MSLRRIAAVAAALLVADPAAAQLNTTGRDQRGTAGAEGPAPGSPRGPWRGTAAKWSQSLTTNTLGIGQNYQSDAGEVYSHGYWLLLNYYAVDDSNEKIRVATSPGFDVELTNSSSTTQLREPQLRDLNLSAIGSFVPWTDPASHQAFALVPNATVLFPTSEASRKTGTYLVTSPRMTLGYSAPFVPDAGPLSSVTLGAQGRWDHRFTEATEPVNASLGERFTRTNPNMAQLPATNLSGSPWAHDTLSAAAFLYFAGMVMGETLSLQLAVVYSQDFLYSFSDTCIQQSSGTCLDVTSSTQASGQEASTTRTSTAFNVAVQYSLSPELTLSLGYLNSAGYLGPDGLARSPFYSPYAVFQTELIISLDAIYESLTGPRRTTNFFLPG